MPDFEDAMPDDFSNEVDPDLGADELRVNFTDKEAESKALDPFPRGNYHLVITDAEVARCGPESKNPGKPYWKLTLTVQEGPYDGRKVWDNCMLFNGALYTLSQLMKALGNDIEEGSFKLPTTQSLIGQHVIGKVRIKPESGQYDARNEIKGYLEYTGKTPAAGESALLP
jgi:hypothetical protein